MYFHLLMSRSIYFKRLLVLLINIEHFIFLRKRFLLILLLWKLLLLAKLFKRILLFFGFSCLHFFIRYSEGRIDELRY
jgi:hypothetical protein